jgi:sulfur relay (sulfurtransferase) DsrC/TusE family protein
MKMPKEKETAEKKEIMERLRRATKEEAKAIQSAKPEKPEKPDKICMIREAQRKAEETDLLMKHAKIDNIDSNCYTEMDNYVGMVKTGAAYGAILEGAGGVGKTWRVIKALEDAKYVYTDSFSTPQAIYIWLYKHRDEDVLVVDDPANFLDNIKILSMLKGGLWNVGDKNTRIIHYMTTKPMQDEEGNYVPTSFVLNARLIIITNFLNKKNPHLNAILSRVNHCIVDIPYEELMKIIEQVARKEYPDLNEKERMEVFKYLRDNTSSATESLNIRTLIKCFQQRVYSKRIGDPELWKSLMTLSILKKNPKLVLVEDLVKDSNYRNEDARIKEFMKQTGASRSTYFRLKDQLK